MTRTDPCGHPNHGGGDHNCAPFAMTYATCGCGTDIATETAAQRHAAVCPRMGEPGTREEVAGDE